MGFDFKLRHRDAGDADAALRAIPVSAIVLFTAKGHGNGYSELVRQLVHGNPAEWIRVETQTSDRGQIDLFLLGDRPAKSIQLPSIDLGRKLGRKVSAEF